MTAIMQTANQWLADRLKDFDSETVTYSRGSQSGQAQAVIGRTVFKVEDSRNRFRLNWNGLDFLIQSADLQTAIGSNIPAKHDRITRADGSIYDVEEVNGEPCYRFSDPYGIELRIHGARAKAPT